MDIIALSKSFKKLKNYYFQNVHIDFLVITTELLRFLNYT